MPILIAEGEKDVIALVEEGFSATCNPGGAGKWDDSYSETLRGVNVIIIPDDDEPGRKHADLVASKLHGIAASVKIVRLPALNGRTAKDAAEFFSLGGKVEDLTAVIDEAPEVISAIIPPSVSGSITADLRGQIISVLTDTHIKGSARNRAVAKIAVTALGKVGNLYFHAERKDFDSAMFFHKSDKRLYRIRSDSFGAWLSDWLGINRADPLFKYAFSEIETAALSSENATAILPEYFWASRPGAIYLSNGDGCVVKITASHVALVNNGIDGVLFAAGRTLVPWTLTTPVDPFESCRLFRDPHCSSPHGKEMLRLWLYSLPSNPPSKPPLCFPGPIGSGKTRTAKGLAELLGIPFIAHKVEENSEDDFWPCCDAGGIFTLDNADTRCRWLPDALANAATDGCSQRRKLYTNNETVTLRARAWLCITTANPTFGGDSGLADRLLVVRMDRRDNEETGDGALSQEILSNRDGGLSHIANTLSTALADTSSVPGALNKRHPDFAAFAVRIGRALGREAQAVAALRAAEADKSTFCLENDAIAAALLAYMRDALSFTGTASELALKLIEVDPELKERLSGRRLGKRLFALWPHLQAAFAVAKRQTDRKGFTIFEFKVQFAEYAEYEMPFP